MWNFGDGATGAGAMVNHTYMTAGTFTATLTVTDNQEASASVHMTVAVTALPPPSTLNAPSNLSAALRRHTVTLHWTDNSTTERGFYIERAKNGSSFKRVGHVSANTKTYADVVARGTYQYRLQAFNRHTGQVSEYSNPVQVQVK